jgi:lysophospholipase
MMLPVWTLADAEVVAWAAPDGWQIRTAVWHAPKPRSTLIFLNGRGDFIEKYAETCRDWSAAGHSVLTWDWRGQGLSGRMFDETARTHLASFDPLVADACKLLTAPAFARLPQPWFLVGHSLGGHLAVRILHEAQSLFVRAVLLAPMLGLNTGPVSPHLLARLVRMLVAAGQGRRFAVGQTPYGSVTRSSFRQQRLTSDGMRFRQESDAIDANPALAVGGVTFGWVQAALQSIATVSAPGFLESVTLPVLALLAGREHIVDSAVAETLLKRLPNGTTTWIDGAAHEMLRERDDIRDNVLGRISDFLDGLDA